MTFHVGGRKRLSEPGASQAASDEMFQDNTEPLADSEIRSNGAGRGQNLGGRSKLQSGTTDAGGFQRNEVSGRGWGPLGRKVRWRTVPCTRRNRVERTHPFVWGSI